jgi:hypothetical protein
VSFKPGDIVFHRGSWDPVTILGAVHIWDGIDGTYPGYQVTMGSWSAPQEQDAKSFVTYNENVEILTREVTRFTDDVVAAATRLEATRDRLAKLLAWGEKHL